MGEEKHAAQIEVHQEIKVFGGTSSMSPRVLAGAPRVVHKRGNGHNLGFHGTNERRNMADVRKIVLKIGRCCMRSITIQYNFLKKLCELA